MMNFNKYIFFLFLLLSVNLTKAQIVTGIIVEKDQTKNQNLIPISDANVVWEGTNLGVVSDKKGMFSIQIPEKLPAKLIVSLVGYQTFTKIIDKSGFHEIEMTRGVYIEEDIEVRGQVNSTIVTTLNPINSQVLTSCELEKAACCNLSESFSTNTSVDVMPTDAVTGAKKIQMLGLDGKYTKVTLGNSPLIRGLSSSFGFTHVPGSWIESIQIIKGTGTVINGYDALTGQINVEYLKNSSKFFWNSYINSESKFENNLVISNKKNNWSNNLFLHYTLFDREMDHNNDNFMDMPKMKNIHIHNNLEYNSDKYYLLVSGRFMDEQRRGGTLSDFIDFDVSIDNRIFDFESKIGLIQPKQPGRSLSLNVSILNHIQRCILGNNNFDAIQESFYLNLIRKTYLFNRINVINYGLSLNLDNFNESFSGNTDQPFDNENRQENVTGAFLEYSNTEGKLSTILGLRADYYNKKTYFLPRLNLKYSFNDQLSFRFSSGRSLRIPNAISENISLLSSNRFIQFPYMYLPEIGYNFGGNITYVFKILGNNATVNLDAYKTIFEDKIIVNLESPGILSFENSHFNSNSNNYQIELYYDISKSVKTKFGHKINHVYSNFDGEDKFEILTPRYRTMYNISYENPSKKWLIDATLNSIGNVRIPDYETNNGKIDSYFSDPYFLLNSQITRKINQWDFYLGAENINNYTQHNPIINSNDPNSDFFDASLIYAPLRSRLFYFGLRFKIK
ncbi:MAG: hypothetical protein CMD02_05295 [Flavobacteriales bacterium]|nr:hypothetical protein [Flavobacteriales bacterium]